MLRFAPSPTGDMHIGDLRVAILNYLISQQKNDQFLVRIEDTDSKHNIEGKDSEIMMLLEKFALKHDSVFHQSEHLNLYQTLALRLLKEKKAFICTCNNELSKSDTPYSGHCENLTQEDYETLKKSAKPFVIRIKKPQQDINYHDNIQGEINATPQKIDSFILLEADGLPTYNFACAADDMMSNINFIIRQEEHLLDTPKQIHIKKQLAYEKETQYAHLPTIINEKETSVISLFEQGFIPDAILNYLLTIGNSNIDKEVFTLPEAIEWFDLNHLSKSSTKFDINKLRFINSKHIKMMDNKQLSTLFNFADADIGKLAKLYLEECSTINELESKIRPIFKSKDFSGEFGNQMKIIENIIFDAPAFETLEELQKYITSESGLKDEMLNKPLRLLLTNSDNGPELSKIYTYIKAYILEVAS